MFSKKTLRVEIQKISGNFTSFSGTYNFVNLPIEVKITKTIAPAGYSGTINIYGISKQLVDSVTMMPLQVDNIDEISAIIYANDGNGENILFEGQVMAIMPNYNNAPDICISIILCAGVFPNLITDVPPSSVEGGVTSTHQLFQKICDDYGMQLKDLQKEDKQINDGGGARGDGLMARLTYAARETRMHFFVKNNIVTIYPRDSFNYDHETVEFTKNDYIGYPSFNASGGIDLKLDRVPFSMDAGWFFNIKGSEIAAANDVWQVIKISHDLSTKIGGKWVTSISGVRIGVEV